MKTNQEMDGRRIAVQLLIPFFVALFLSSCSCDGEKGEATSKTKVLTVWHTEVDPQAIAVFDQIIKKFQEIHPGVTVRQEAVPWGQLSQKLVTAFVSGEVPDVTHLQPFMTASLYHKGQLLNIDDVIEKIGMENIFPAIRDLQYFDGHYYGIAYGLGSTFFSVRKDLLAERGLKPPKTWNEYLETAKLLTVRNSSTGIVERYGVALPGDPFFIDQFAAELVASNGGRLYDEKMLPVFTEKQVIEMLDFFRELSRYAPPDWTRYTYLEQFQAYASGKVAMVPVCYARALKNIEKDADSTIADSSHFGFIPQPHGPSGKIGFATLDCENWAILKNAKQPDLAKELLKFFYQPENYLPFCQSVPIHLTPIFASMANSENYLATPMVKRWREWQQQSNKVLAEGNALPILMSNKQDRLNPYLMELQGKHIITDMVLAVCKEGFSSEKAAKAAQAKALEIINAQ